MAVKAESVNTDSVGNTSLSLKEQDEGQQEQRKLGNNNEPEQDDNNNDKNNKDGIDYANESENVDENDNDAKESMDDKDKRIGVRGRGRFRGARGARGGRGRYSKGRESREDYVNPNRHETGGTKKERMTEEELEKKLQAMRIHNEKLEKQQKAVEEDEAEYEGFDAGKKIDAPTMDIQEKDVIANQDTKPQSESKQRAWDINKDIDDPLNTPGRRKGPSRRGGGANIAKKKSEKNARLDSHKEDKLREEKEKEEVVVQEDKGGNDKKVEGDVAKVEDENEKKNDQDTSESTKEKSFGGSRGRGKGNRGSSNHGRGRGRRGAKGVDKPSNSNDSEPAKAQEDS